MAHRLHTDLICNSYNTTSQHMSCMPITAFHMLFSCRANQMYRAEVINYVHTTLNNNIANVQMQLQDKQTWGSGPLLRMACTSPVSFNCFLCTVTEKNQCFHSSWHLYGYISLPMLFSTREFS